MQNTTIWSRVVVIVIIHAIQSNAEMQTLEYECLGINLSSSIHQLCDLGKVTSSPWTCFPHLKNEDNTSICHLLYLAQRVASLFLFTLNCFNFKNKSPISWETPQSWAKQDSWPPCRHIRSSTVDSAFGFIALSCLSHSWNQNWSLNPWTLLKSRAWS